MKKLSAAIFFLAAMTFFAAPAHAGFIDPIVAVPETGGTLALLGIALTALVLLRRTLAK